MLCTICHRPIVLVPSAADRARRFGGRPEDYTALFTEHAHCTLKRRAELTSELMRRLRAEFTKHKD